MLFTRAQLQAIIHEETSFALYKVNKKHFESGKKVGKMLAIQLQQIKSNL